jgi:DMSO/TMAO reductase YedYZ molybdopterin-dependent catalytic subunit
MSTDFSRRKLITTGLATAASVVGLAAAVKIADHYGLLAPDSGGIYGPGEALTYAAQRILMSHHSMAREFNPSEISKVVPVSGPALKTDDYQKSLSKQFADWRITVDGLVARPASFSIHELKRMPVRTQITHQACEEGWAFIAQWHGVPLSHVLSLVGPMAAAKYVVYYSLDSNWWDSLDLPDAYHAQTYLAYGLNGADLSPDHGAPIRMKVARQLGYKSVKFLTKITLVDSLKHVGDGRGSAAPSTGYSWYAGI